MSKVSTGCALLLAAALASTAFGDKPVSDTTTETFTVKSGKKETKMAPKSVLDFKMKNIDGKEVKMADYKGKVLLMVNVASRCGYTKQYTGLEKIHEQYKKDGLVVMGFPSNDFGAQEPGTDAEIKAFCTTDYGVTFPMFSKIPVKGDQQNSLYKFLTEKETNPKFAGEIKWNFEKFLVDRKGNVVARFKSADAPEDEKVLAAITTALAEKVEQPAEKTEAKADAAKQ